MPETPVFSTAAVAAPHRRAAEIGQTILASGGNAVEAVIAMAATCAVVLPHLNGLGGDAFFLVRETRGRVHGIDASGPAGALATIERYRDKEYDTIPEHGSDAALTVAGVVGGWSLGLELAKALGGQLPLDMLLADAVRLAREGYAVTPTETRARLDDSVLAMAPFANTFLAEGKRPEAGNLRRMAKLADTLERLSHAGLEDFYRGDVSREIALDLERIGSPIIRRDLETYRARVVEPLSVRLRDSTVYNLPAPSQGFGALLALGIADRLRLQTSETAAYHHAIIEATKRALVLRDRFITDPREMDEDLADLLAGHLIEREAAQIDHRRAFEFQTPPRGEGDAAWIGCIDKDGLAVSYVQSIHGPFGSGCLLPNTGILWHNRGMDFSLDANSRNPLSPGRKPFHTLSPALAVFADHRVLAFGVAGLQGQAQIFSRYADLNMGLADAVDAPRWKLARSDHETTTMLRIEDRFDPGMMRTLAQGGHPVEEIGRAYADEMGCAGMILRHARNGRIEATHDARGDGDAEGL